MGYYSRFEIETHPPLVDFTISIDYKAGTDSSGMYDSQDTFKWYDCKEDILKASRLHQGTLFIVDRFGEGDGMEIDVERTFTKNGKSYSWKLEYTPPDFDESELK